MTTISNGGAPLDNSRLSEFVHLAESAHLACDFSISHHLSALTGGLSFCVLYIIYMSSAIPDCVSTAHLMSMLDAKAYLQVKKHLLISHVI